MIDVANRCIIINDKIIKFSEIMMIEGFYFRLEYDEMGGKRFNADISFIATQKDAKIPLKIKFYDVIRLRIEPESMYTTGFGIFDMEDTKQRGWLSDCRYHFHFQDYEAGEMDFYCSEIELME